MGRVAHAYLFTGPRGVGKTSAARILAKAVNCLQPDGTNPCNVCDNCQEITSGTSMDVVEIDGASNRGIDEIRELREAVRFLPLKCKHKVYIIDEVHMLTEHAFNALLKTLEEPPDYVMFILATTDPQRIPATIISRCQKYDFNKIPFNIMYDTLANALGNEGVSFDKDALSLVVRNSDGCMRDSLSLLDQIIAFTGGKLDEQSTSFLLGFSEKTIIDKLFSSILKEDSSSIPEVVAELSGKGINFTFATETLIEHTRNLLMMMASRKDNPEFTAKENEFYKGLAKDTSESRLYALFQVFQKLLNDIKFFSFEQYVFEFGMFKAASIGSIVSTGGMQATTSSSAKPAAPIGKPQQTTPQRGEAPTPSAPSVPKPKAEASDRPTFSSSDIDLQRILDALMSANQPLIASNLGHGYIVQNSGGELVIGFSMDKKFHHGYINKPANIPVLKKIVCDTFPEISDVKVTLEQDSKKKSIVEKKQKIETFQEKKTREEAREDELVVTLMKEFNGKIEDIKCHKS